MMALAKEESHTHSWWCQQASLKGGSQRSGLIYFSHNEVEDSTVCNKELAKPVIHEAEAIQGTQTVHDYCVVKGLQTAA